MEALPIIHPEGRQFLTLFPYCHVHTAPLPVNDHATSSATAMTTIAMYPNNVRSESGSGCMSKRTSMMLEEEIKLHRFAGISPDQTFTEAGRHCEAVVAAD